MTDARPKVESRWTTPQMYTQETQAMATQVPGAEAMTVTERTYKLVCLVTVSDYPRLEGLPHTLATACADIANRANRGDGYSVDIDVSEATLVVEGTYEDDPPEQEWEPTQ